MPKISIIIATYNSGRTLRAALESVHSQTFQNWECIIVDGASKDDTIDIVKEYCAKDSRFRYISEPDNGIYDAFNKGWRMAKGEWIHYLGSDDTLTFDGMSKVVAELDDTYAIVTGNVYLHRVDGTVKEQQYNGYFGCHQGVLMQRRAIATLNGFDEYYQILADYDLLVRNFRTGNKVKNVPSVIANFTVGGESQKLSSQWEKMKERYWIYRRNHVTRFPFLRSFSEYLSMSSALIYRNFINCFNK